MQSKDTICSYVAFKEEIGVVLLLGSVPAFLALYIGGLELLMSSTKAATTVGYLFFYSFILGLLYVLIAFIENKCTFIHNSINDIITLGRRILAQVGLGIHATCRTIVGTTIILPVLWLFSDPSTFQVGVGLLVVALGFAMLVGCVYLSHAVAKISAWNLNKK